MSSFFFVFPLSKLLLCFIVSFLCSYSVYKFDHMFKLTEALLIFLASFTMFLFNFFKEVH